MLGLWVVDSALGDPAPIDFDYDYNRDGKVNATDMLLARNNPTSFIDALKLITVPDGEGLIPPPNEVRAPAASMDWLNQYEHGDQGGDSTTGSKRGATPIGKLLANGWL